MTEKQREIIKELVRNYLIKNLKLISSIELDENTLNHVINTGTELLSTKWGLQTYSGDFVKSILDNKLTETFGRADEINEKFIKFYVLLKYNVGKPYELEV